MSPFALVAEIRRFFDGAIVLAGAISTGAQIAAARLMGADLAYLGTRFIATRESLAPDAYKAMLVEAHGADIVYTPAISGVNANFLRQSIAAAGLDPDNLASTGRLDLKEEAMVWRTIWSAGHGVGSIEDVPSAAELCARLTEEYRAAARALPT
jgi:nitronate monooxygenase